MEDVHTFHTRNYDRSELFKDPTLMQRFLTLLPVLPSIVLKTLAVILLEIFYVLRELFHFMVPRTLKDIRGQLAAVGVKLAQKFNGIGIGIKLGTFDLYFDFR